MAKLNANKTSSRRKMRKAHFGATSVERRARMSAPLSKELFQRHHVSALCNFFRLLILRLRITLLIHVLRITLLIHVCVVFRFDLCHWEKMMKWRLFAVASMVRRERLFSATERNMLFTLSAAPETRPTGKLFTSELIHQMLWSLKLRWTSAERQSSTERTVLRLVRVKVMLPLLSIKTQNVLIVSVKVHYWVLFLNSVWTTSSALGWCN